MSTPAMPGAWATAAGTNTSCCWSLPRGRLWSPPPSVPAARPRPERSGWMTPPCACSGRRTKPLPSASTESRFSAKICLTSRPTGRSRSSIRLHSAGCRPPDGVRTRSPIRWSIPGTPHSNPPIRSAAPGWQSTPKFRKPCWSPASGTGVTAWSGPERPYGAKPGVLKWSRACRNCLSRPGSS